MSEEAQRFWSVTTLLKEGMGTSRSLVQWNARIPAETAFDKIRTLQAFVADGDRNAAVKWLMESRYAESDKAKARGSEIHAAAEALALGKPISIADNLLPYVEQYRLFLNDFSPTFLLAEAPVYSPRYSYAGTTDGIFQIDGQKLIFDIKTTPTAPGEVNDSGKPKARGPYTEVALQLAAYRHAELVGLIAERVETYSGRYYTFNPENHHEPMPATDGAIAIMLSPYDYRVVPVQADERIFKYFLAVRECARYQVEASKHVFGPPIGVPDPQKALL